CLGDVHLSRPDTELEERVCEVPDEEDHRIADEPDRGDPHQPRPPLQIPLDLTCPRTLRCDGRHRPCTSLHSGRDARPSSRIAPFPSCNEIPSGDVLSFMVDVASSEE